MNSDQSLTCFKAYDVRGKLGKDLNEEIAYRIGRATAQSLSARNIILGFDARQTSPKLAKAVARGACDAGSDVLEIGLAGTEEMYAAVLDCSTCAGIEVTASHNPIGYNGIKMVKRGSQPLSDREFANIKHLAEKNDFKHTSRNGIIIDKRQGFRESYITKIISFVELGNLKPLKILINSGNGAAGPTVDALSQKLQQKGVETNFVLLQHEPDPSFPNGIPNPLLEENRGLTANAVVREGADFGVAFDGDFDRCFFFDHVGNFIPSEYIVGLLAEVFLNKEKGATIVHDPRTVWNTTDVVRKCNGHAVVSRTGHGFVKAVMRDYGAIYGGEMSAHHYFRDFAYCDSGMIPWLLIWELISKKNLPISELIFERKSLFPSSGELNFTVSDSAKCIQKVKEQFTPYALSVDELDGLSMSFESWRFNLRKSNTEALVRLNVEAKGDYEILKEKTEEVQNIVQNL